jgi:hypothetical protein
MKRPALKDIKIVACGIIIYCPFAPRNIVTLTVVNNLLTGSQRILDCKV